MRLEALRLRDLNLLSALHALLSMQGVSAAARALGMSQPAVSKCLERLRRDFDDPLLVRDGNRMRLTPRAEALLPLVGTALDHVADVFAVHGPFNPSRARGRVRIGANDYVQLALGGELTRRVRRAAPRVVLEFRPAGMLHPEQLLVDGVVDLIVGTKWPNLSLRTQLLYADPFVCVVGSDHRPLPDRLDVDAFCALEHLDVSPSGIGLLRMVFDQALAQHDRPSRSRRVAARCASFMAVPEMLRGTGLVALVPQRLLPLYPPDSVRTVALDFELPPYEVSLWWHNATHADPLARWVREQLMALTLEAPQPAEP